MNVQLKKVEAWPFTFGGQEHSGWLPPEVVTPKPTPTERELLDVTIEQTDGGFLLIWTARPSATCRDALPPKSGDTWHDTIDDAEAAACKYFGIQHEHWRGISATA